MDPEQLPRANLRHADVRRRLEEAEERYLSPLAARSARAMRDRDEEPSPLRTAFQRDRDRIVHSKAFRRLKHKTQVFIAPEGDHYRTRLTHTLEVTQVARTIGRALRLNEDLIEAIGVGHDIGHAPFGHAGETALSRAHGQGFRHNEQSRRIVEVLEHEGTGLNLTYDVREGIYMHSKVRKDISARGWGVASTLEGQIIKLADSIAYVNHDIDDAIRAGLLREGDLPADVIAVLGDTHGKRINTMVCDMIDHNWWATGEGAAPDPPLISMSPAILDATNALRDFMFRNVYLANPVNQDTEQVRFVIEHLYHHFVTHPQDIPADLHRIAADRNEPVERAALDQVAGMTDRYALKCFDAIFVPHA